MVESRRLGPYTILNELAHTAHSRVWRAVGPDGREVAVKELKVRRIDAEPYRRFRDEVAFHTAGPHTGVLPVIAAQVPPTPSRADPAWLAMPIAMTVTTALGPDPTLDEIVAALSVYARTLAGLADAAVYHRDLKPDNLFALDDQWLVGDFGLVTWPGKQALTEPGQKLGPAHYVAPEMVEDPASADPGPADVWSLAKVLWVLATGQHYPAPGQLRIAEPATRLRNYNRHPRAAGLEGILEQATRLMPSERPTMEFLAGEFETWCAPSQPLQEPAGIGHLIERVRAISAPAVAAKEEQAALEHEADGISDQLRAAHQALLPLMQSLGRPIWGDQTLSLHGLGGKTGRRDVARVWGESLALTPHSAHQVSLTIDVAWELFDSWDIRLVAGMYFHGHQRLPEPFLLETRDVRVGTEQGRRAADDLAQLLIDQFPLAAARYADLLAQAEAQAQQSRQSPMESVGIDYIFRTRPEAGVIEILRRSDRSVDGHGVAWLEAPLIEIRAEGNSLYVRSETHEGWMERNSKQHWTLVRSEAIAH